jgi:hypothetical protein
MGLGSGIRKKPIPDPGTRIQGSKRYRIPDPESGSATLAKNWTTTKFKDGKSGRRKEIGAYVYC